MSFLSKMVGYDGELSELERKFKAAESEEEAFNLLSDDAKQELADTGEYLVDMYNGNEDYEAFDEEDARILNIPFDWQKWDLEQFSRWMAYVLDYAFFSEIFGANYEELDAATEYTGNEMHKYIFEKFKEAMAK